MNGHSVLPERGSAMQRSTKRFLTTHVGSLIRPAVIIRAMRRMANGLPLDEAFNRTLTASIEDVVRHQKRCGVDIPSDGEFGKTGWTGYHQRFGGLEPAKPDEV